MKTFRKRGFYTPVAALYGSASVAATTWNNSDKTSGLVLSNSNRTVTYPTGGNTNQGIRSVAFVTTNQKVYIEHTINAVTTGMFIGFVTIGSALAGSGAVDGSPSTGFAWSLSGQFRDGDSPDFTTVFGAACTVGDRMGMAFDSQTMKSWIRKNGGAWNANFGGGNPAVGSQSGGATVVVTGSPLYAYVTMDANNGDQFTTNFASTNWVDTAPTGYTQLQ